MLVLHLTAGAQGAAALVRDDADRYDLVARLHEGLGPRLLAYGVMRTHVHTTAEGDEAIARFERALAAYARGFNARHGVEGRLRGPIDVRPKTTPFELARAIRYDHENPLVARGSPFERTFEYRWSSAREFAGLSLAGIASVERAARMCERPAAALVGGGAARTVVELAGLGREPRPRFGAEEVLAAAAQTYGLPVQALVGPERKGLPLLARATFLRLALLEGFSVSRVAPLIGRCQARASRIGARVEVSARALRVARTLLRDPRLLPRRHDFYAPTGVSCHEGAVEA